jgi:vacuolar-type H+-ATPase subunit H
MSDKDKVQASCVYTKRKVSDLRAEAERLIATGEMPTLAQVLEAVAEAQKKYADQIRAARAEGGKNSKQ